MVICIKTPHFYTDSALAKKKSNNSDKVIPSYQQRQSRLFVLKKKRVNFPDDSSKINDLLLNSTTKGAPYKCCALSTNQNTVSTLLTSTPTNGNNNAKVIMIDTLPGRLVVVCCHENDFIIMLIALSAFLLEIIRIIELWY